MIFAIGDSHSILYYNSHSIKHHWVGWGGMPVTMYRLVKEGIPLYNIVERFPPGEICNINIKDNDFVLFIYGFNDVQKNIGKYSNKDTYPFQIFSILILQDSMSHSEFYILRTVFKNYIRNNFKQGLISNMQVVCLNKNAFAV